MRFSLTVMLVAGLVLGGFPHAFCQCAWAEGSQPVAPPVCHACGGGPSAPVPETPEPCQCRTCEVVKAVAGPSPMSVPALDLTSRVPPAAVAPSVRLVSADSPEDFSPAAEPPGQFAHLGCALTVFLGRLLL
jgi:hypothetical protein